MKKLITNIIYISLIGFLSLSANKVLAQVPCTDLCNGSVGIYSRDACSVDYDVFQSAFHATMGKLANCDIAVSGSESKSDGVTPNLSPVRITPALYPGLTGQVLKSGISSNYTGTIIQHQFCVLTTDGLFVWGAEGIMMDNLLTTGTIFQKVIVGGKADGLPAGVSPTDVKMWFSTNGGIAITTKTGEVYVLSDNVFMRGSGSPSANGSNITWSQVMEDATTPLTGVCATRGATDHFMALKSDGTVWNWGNNTYLGDGTVAADRFFATKMTLPAGVVPQMIQSAAAYDYIAGGGVNTSHYILGTDGKIYGIGNQGFGILGNTVTTGFTNTWVTAKAPPSYTTDINDAAYISSNEFDNYYVQSFNMLSKTGLQLTWGENSRYAIGGPVINAATNPVIPNGIFATDVITLVETGGHVTVNVKRGAPKFGYVGHRVTGSMGDGTAIDIEEPSYNYTETPNVNICGASCLATKPDVKSDTLKNVCPSTTVNLRSRVLSVPDLPVIKLAFYETKNPVSLADSIINPQAYMSTGIKKIYARYIDPVNKCSVVSDSMIVAFTICPAGALACNKTILYPAPIVGTPQQLDLIVTIDVSVAGGCFDVPVTVTGSGMSLVEPLMKICPIGTGPQTFHLPVKYDGSPLGTMNFTILGAGSCAVDLTTTPGRKGVCEIWTLDKCSPVLLAPKLK